MKKPLKFIIDTDPGDDIDDAFALYFGLIYEKLDVIGVTTVYENTHLRARLVKKLLRLIGRDDIPVFAGYGQPFDGEHFQSLERKFCQYAVDLDDPAYAPDNAHEGSAGESAVDFIIRSAETHRENLVLFCIGPLTNIARAIKKNPEAMRHVGQVVMMNGAFYSQYREWNVICDVEAAKTVYDFGFNLHAVGADVTILTELQADFQARFLTAHGQGAFGYLLDLSRLWMVSYKRLIMLHDLLACYYFHHPTLFETETVPVHLETDGLLGKGMTFNLAALQPRHPLVETAKKVTCVKAIDLEGFMQDVLAKLEDALKECSYETSMA